MRSVLARLFALLTLAAPAFAQPPAGLAAAIETQFAHKLLILRGLYCDANIRFDSNGSLLGSSETAFAVSDAQFDLQHAEIKRNRLILRGDLPVTFYDEKTGEVTHRISSIHRTVEIELAEPTSSAAMAAIWKVFYQPNEKIPGTCTLEEFKQQQAQAQAARAAATNSPADGKPDDPLAFGDRSAENKKILCRANGDQVVTYITRRHSIITPPQPIHTPDPDYPAKAPSTNATVVLDLVVDPHGHPSSFIVTRPFGYGFDEAAVSAVNGWKFAPASREGDPVPMTISVEVNFH